jgi:hypothetical protein
MGNSATTCSSWSTHPSTHANKHLSSHSNIFFPMISPHIVRKAVLTLELTIAVRDARSASLGARARGAP